MGLRVFATPDPTVPELHGDGLGPYYDRAHADAGKHGHQSAKGYTSIADLIAKIEAVLVTNPNDCLELIEVNAHGNPQLCNGITHDNAGAFGAQLKAWHTGARLCDEVEIYLTGCNTGVRTTKTESIAQHLSGQTPTVAGENVRITVYGTAGYCRGNHMSGSARTSTDATVKHGTEKNYFAPYPDVTDSSGTVHPGSRGGTGAASYRGYREGRPA
jgi:hypothetical protein